MHVIVLHLAYGPRRAKMILLTDDLPEGLSAVCGPLYDEFLRTLVLRFAEHEMKTTQILGRIKHEPDHLRARVGGAPTGMRARDQRRFNGESRILERDFHLRQLLNIEPRRTRGWHVVSVMIDEPFARSCIENVRLIQTGSKRDMISPLST